MQHLFRLRPPHHRSAPGKGRRPSFEMVERLEPRRLLALAVASAGPDLSGRDHAFEITFTGGGGLDPGTLDAGDVRVENLTHNWTAGNPAVAFDAATQKARLDLVEGNGHAPGYLPDGNYELTVWMGGPGGLRGLDGSTPADVFRLSAADDAAMFFLAGDANRDRVVSMSDFAVLRMNTGLADVGHAGGDFNGDGVVDIGDFAILRSAFGRNLELPPSYAGEVVADYATTGSIDLSWHLGTANAADPLPYDGFRVFRAEGSSSEFEQVAELRNDDADPLNDWLVAGDGTIGRWTDTGLVDGTLYRYDVRAFTDAAGNAPWTDDAAAWTLLNDVNDLTASMLDQGDVYLQWQPAGTGPTHYLIDYREDADANWKPAGEVSGWDRDFVVDNIPGDRTQRADYQYRVTAQTRDMMGDVLVSSLGSEPVEAILAPPTLLAADSAVPDRVGVSWQPSPDSTATHYTVQHRLIGAPDWSSGTTINAWEELATISGLQDNREHEVRVRAEVRVYSGDGESLVVKGSDWTEPVAFTIKVIPPSSVNAVAVDANTVRVDWIDNSSGEQGYIVERADAGSDNWSIVSTVSANVETVTVAASTDTEQRYRVTASADGTTRGSTTEDPHTVTARDGDHEADGTGTVVEVRFDGSNAGARISESVRITELNAPHQLLVLTAGVDVNWSTGRANKVFHHGVWGGGEPVEASSASR